jgi:predicted DNA-binding protein (UPF0251 family)
VVNRPNPTKLEKGEDGADASVRLTPSRQATMPRPRKRRILSRAGRTAVYKPAGIALHDLRQVRLLAEELEALRLADLEGLTQAEAAGRMGVSRSTFQRIVQHARRQVALALAETHALHIEGSLVAPDRRPRTSRGRHPSGSRRLG